MGSHYRTNRATPALLPPAVPLGEGHANQQLHTQILDKVLVSTTADIAQDALTRSWSRRLSVSTRAASGREAVMSRSRGRAQVEVVIRGLRPVQRNAPGSDLRMHHRFSEQSATLMKLF
ncbi:hypothetical protein CEP54_003156 [Fusarium duplospermum]|uniref:Uncharacterized protein n=1 Tax=Fusarium duplospermum TaxID=1325734 RepID=A0A428QRA0_9HYPO|nr:hypothetical protein CEP54_003156 [Fusarium duplospermum]